MGFLSRFFGFGFNPSEEIEKESEGKEDWYSEIAARWGIDKSDESTLDKLGEEQDSEFTDISEEDDGESGKWTRPVGEYPEKFVNDIFVCDYREAQRRIDRRDKRSEENTKFDEVDCFLMGIRGLQFYDKELRGSKQGEVVLELVPEPSNPYDPFAVAVDLEGKRIGYIGERVAYRIQWILRVLNGEGKRCLTYGWASEASSSYDYPEGWVVVPTEHFLLSQINFDRQQEKLREAWEKIPRELKGEVVENRYRLNSSVAGKLLEYRHLEPSMFPTIPEANAFGPWWRLLFQKLKDEKKKNKEAEREILLEDRRKKREERDSARKLRDEEIVSLYENGSNNKVEIARLIGVSRSTVDRVLKKAYGEGL